MTKLTACIRRFFQYVARKMIVVSGNIFLILFGFVAGTLFGSVLTVFLKPEALIQLSVAVTLLFVEVLNAFTYRKFLFKNLNLVKIGFLLGVFIDAFKVGS
uniref:Hypothetical chloroplast RF20 n=1 Tax=Stichococcus bacillaris TaxID=37433 RepID=A0A097KKJ0_9CHLO|nr:hypothetical chloroplast RF20 [Stichococcus bacillaris]AIT93706.1 hypothetical chloroplast RF20 [Stichococcus bacillaris]